MGSFYTNPAIIISKQLGEIKDKDRLEWKSMKNTEDIPNKRNKDSNTTTR